MGWDRVNFRGLLCSACENFGFGVVVKGREAMHTGASRAVQDNIMMSISHTKREGHFCH